MKKLLSTLRSFFRLDHLESSPTGPVIPPAYRPPCPPPPPPKRAIYSLPRKSPTKSLPGTEVKVLRGEDGSIRGLAYYIVPVQAPKEPERVGLEDVNSAVLCDDGLWRGKHRDTGAPVIVDFDG